MFGIIDFGAFLLAGIILNLTPGADTMYILSRSIAEGKKAGILSALGISTGSLLHTLFAALGLSILVAESQLAFNVVKYAGAIYLIYLGLKAILNKNKNSLEIDQNIEHQKNGKIYLSGILTNVLNPKIALFYIAFLPQFIDPEFAGHFISFLILGAVFTFTGTIWCLILVFFAAKFSDRIKRSPQVKIWMDRMAGMVFIILGIKLALSK